MNLRDVENVLRFREPPIQWHPSSQSPSCSTLPTGTMRRGPRPHLTLLPKEASYPNWSWINHQMDRLYVKAVQHVQQIDSRFQSKGSSKIDKKASLLVRSIPGVSASNSPDSKISSIRNYFPFGLSAREPSDQNIGSFRTLDASGYYRELESGLCGVDCGVEAIPLWQNCGAFTGLRKRTHTFL